MVHDDGARPLRRLRRLGRGAREARHRAARAARELAPIIDNEFKTDLEPELREGDEITESIRDAGVRLGALNLLPNPFPIEDLLTERELRHVKRLYGIGGRRTATSPRARTPTASG